MRFRWLKRGVHYSRGKRFTWPDPVESNLRLDLLYPDKFELEDAGPIPLKRPRKLGRTEPIGREERPRGDGSMGIFIQNRQHFVPVPTGQGVTLQELVVLEDEVEILRQAVPVGSDGMEPVPDALPTFWAEVGKSIILEVTYKTDDGRISDPYETSYIQEDPWPTPEPAPEPEPEPAPEPAPLPQIPAPTGLGVTEAINKVDSPSRPVQRRGRR